MADDIVRRLQVYDDVKTFDTSDIDDFIDQSMSDPNFARAYLAHLHEQRVMYRSALTLAVGELSTHGEYRNYSPDQLMQQFLKEARREP